MLPTLNPHPPPRAWVTFPAVFQLTRHSECQQPDPRSSMRHFRTFPSPGITAEDPSVSRTRRFAHETSSEGHSVSRMRLFAHETTSEGHSVSRTRRLAHETTLADPFVSRTRRSAHETTSEDPSVSRTRLFAHETAAKDTRGNRGAFSASYGNSMETLRALYDAAEVRPEPVGLVIGLSAFRNRHLDG